MLRMRTIEQAAAELKQDARKATIADAERWAREGYDVTFHLEEQAVYLYEERGQEDVPVHGLRETV